MADKLRALERRSPDNAEEYAVALDDRSSDAPFPSDLLSVEYRVRLSATTRKRILSGCHWTSIGWFFGKMESARMQLTFG